MVPRERDGASRRGRPMSSRPASAKLSAVIACYGDAPAVPIMYERLKTVFVGLGVEYEIIFVNDGSPDDARAVLKDLASRDSRVVVVNHARAFGSQNAFTSGMRIATGDAVVLLDGDLQDPPELITAFFAKWREGFDVVYGVRTRRQTSALWNAAYKAFYRAFRAVSYVNMPLDAGDFALIDRRVVDVLNALPENNRFVRGLRAWAGFEQTGVPYTRPERMFGRSTNSLLRNIGWARKAILSFSYVPLDFINVLAFVIVVASLLAIVAQVLVRIFAPQLVPLGFTTLIVLMLFLGGIQLLSLSIIGSYLMHIYDEVKRRPPYVVESIWNAPAGKTPDSRE
jgi:glycosyltransferase involved in cell wall biosynthesis